VEPTYTNQCETTLPHQRTDALGIYADDLQQIVHDLLRKTHVSPAQIQNLARRIRLDVETISTSELFASLKLSPQIGLPTCKWRLEPAVYATGIRSACLLAHVAPRLFGWNDRTELLVIAALIQDTGILLLERQYDLAIDRLAVEEPEAYRQHPALSAALAGALTDYAVDLPAVIAQHQERCDGTGFPSGMRADQLAAPSRFLAVAVRYVELTKDETTGESRAAGQLMREAEQGEFDMPLTAAFLQQLGLDVLQEDRPTLGRHFQLDRFGEKQFRQDGGVLGTDGLPVAETDSQVPAVNEPHSDNRSTRRRTTIREGTAAQP